MSNSPFLAVYTCDTKKDLRVFQALATSSTDDGILFLSINVEDELHDISEKYEVATIPHFVFLKGGKVLDRVKGVDPKELGVAIAMLVSVGESSIPPQQTTTAPPVTTANGKTSGSETEEIEEDIDTRLGKLVKAAPVMLFMKGTPIEPQCGFSGKLVALLREKGVRYGFFNILADDEVRQGLKTFSDWPTFPQLYLDGNLLGGLDIVSFTPNFELVLGRIWFLMWCV